MFPKNQLRFVVLAVFLLGGCGDGGRITDAPKAQPPAAFDPKDAEVTFRWLIEKAKPILASGKLSHDEQSNNPLRKEHYNAHQANAAQWNKLIDSLIGKQVLWPVAVQNISVQAVDVGCIPEKMEQDRVEVSARFAEYPGGMREHFAGRLIIGTHITLADAKRLNRGTMFHVQGMIEKIENSVASANGLSSEYIVIYINNSKAVLP